MKLPKTWLITDTHFNHRMLEDKGHRPVGFTETILANWRRLVSEQDTVFHLGDVILGQNGTLGDILASVPGRKILVRGNHDHESNAWYERHGFAFVAQGILHGGVWLTHAPQANLPDGAIVNVHGHLHMSDRHPPGLAHCKLLVLEKTDYCPVEFDEFVGFSPMTRRLLGSMEDPPCSDEDYREAKAWLAAASAKETCGVQNCSSKELVCERSSKHTGYHWGVNARLSTQDITGVLLPNAQRFGIGWETHPVRMKN